MGKKRDIGWEYLNNDDMGSFDTEDGSWGYQNEDGSGSYHGADGSWGYKNEDGSASYHGADGSWGYRNADGSMSYYGADGSWGYKNEDGSGSYHGNGEDKYYYADDSDDEDDSDYEEDDEDSNGWLSNLIGAGIAGLAAVAIAHNAQEERIRMEKERARRERQEIRREKRNAFLKKHWKGILKTALCILAVLVIAIAYWEYQNWIPVGIASSDIEGEHYESVEGHLEDNGFTDVYSWGMYDLEADELDDEGSVAEITIDDKDNFDAKTKFRFDSDVVIKYHSAKLVDAPISAKEAQGVNYKKIRTQFKEAGFVNIIVEAEYDLITGWINQDGDVKEIIINRDNDFELEDSYRVDSEVKIIYHSFKKNKK